MRIICAGRIIRAGRVGAVAAPALGALVDFDSALDAFDEAGVNSRRKG